MSNNKLDATPVVIIGAGRSGTNMLRNVLTRLDGFATWPCDEINYIWRHGNRSHASDEFSVADARVGVKSYIRGCFSKMIKSARFGSSTPAQRFIVEKTCANSLRVPFVDAVLPEAKYIFLVRDGRDVIASARKRWKAPLDIPYLLAKARYVPVSDLPFYGGRYLLNRLSKRKSSDQALAVWGPKFTGMQELGKEKGLDHVCATQWAKCVDASIEAFQEMPDDKVLKVHYEHFVNHPVDTLKRITDFLGYECSLESLQAVCTDVQTISIGKGKVSLSEQDQTLVNIMLPALEQHDYV